MNSHLIRDLENLKQRVLKVAIAVEENVRRSAGALRELSERAAEEVVEKDIAIDKMEVDTEEECLKILALHQPVASDLRFVVTVLKINNELEHIGDMAANIAKRVAFIKSQPKIEAPFNLEKTASHAVAMLKNSIDAFIKGDEFLALNVCESDEIIDDENRKCYVSVERALKGYPETAMAQINYLLVSKSFERIADLCTNIAEDVIYMKHSLIVRHNVEAAAERIRKDAT